MILDRPSPNFGPRRDVSAPDMVVLHYTAMQSAGAAADRLCDPMAEVSAHYLIDIGGAAIRMVDEVERAWHAGVSHWGGIDDINSHSIGIELANPGHANGYPPFPEPQMAALEEMLGEILKRWPIPPERVVGHACIAPGRKIDPGEKLDWRRLARAGLAIWRDPPLPSADSKPTMDVAAFQQAAQKFGYGVPQSGAWCGQTQDVWDAFAMRFLPNRLGSLPDPTALAHLQTLAQIWPANRLS
jgi:N-acetylmuramoyl-L-alanine amidase